MKHIADRAVDELGRIVLPAETRQKLGVNERDTMSIFEKGNSIVIKKSESVPHCSFCGKTENLLELTHTSKKSYVCANCKNEIEKLK